MEPGGSMPHSQGLSNNQNPRPCETFLNEDDFYSVRLLPPSCWTTPGRLSMTAYSIYSQLTFISGAIRNPGDAPCRGDRNPWMDYNMNTLIKFCSEAYFFRLEDHSWLAVHDCLFNIFTTNLHIWRPAPPSASPRGGGVGLQI